MNKKAVITAVAILALGGMAMTSFFYANAGVAEEPFDVDSCLKACDLKVQETLEQLADSNGNCNYMEVPRNVAPGDSAWNCRAVSPEEWCAGFWPGVLWYDYENTGSREIKEEADKYTRSLKTIADAPIFDHDLGFLMLCSYGNGYRITRNPEYKQVLLGAADSLATLFNPAVGTICSWPRNVGMFGGHNTIMDNMINLELLFWASKNGGSSNLYDIAVSHAEVTMKNHFRPDGTCYHVAVYDPVTGEFKRGCTHQGYSDSSTWARGQAWAIYGYTMVYRETRDPKFLEFAQKVTNVYLDRLPEDRIPFWDFDDPTIPNCSRDASAAAVVASALLELEGYVNPDIAKRYHAEAIEMIKNLASDKYWSKESPSFLLHSTGHRPAQSEIDYSIIYADYYYIEALTRLKRHDTLLLTNR